MIYSGLVLKFCGMCVHLCLEWGSCGSVERVRRNWIRNVGWGVDTGFFFSTFARFPESECGGLRRGVVVGYASTLFKREYCTEYQGRYFERKDFLLKFVTPQISHTTLLPCGDYPNLNHFNQWWNEKYLCIYLLIYCYM